MTNLPQVLYVIQEMFAGGMVAETNEKIIMGPAKVLDNIK